MDNTIGFGMEKYTIIPSLVQVDEGLGQKLPQVRKSNSPFCNFSKILNFLENFEFWGKKISGHIFLQGRNFLHFFTFFVFLKFLENFRNFLKF